jgi:hypothetical protein
MASYSVEKGLNDLLYYKIVYGLNVMSMGRNGSNLAWMKTVVSQHSYNQQTVFLLEVRFLYIQIFVVIQVRLDPFLPIYITLNPPSCSVEGIFAIVEIQ